jgi:predicted dehydrogenase
MDYTSQNFSFKTKKVLRYIRLYGLKRTLIKIAAQYHMKRKYTSLPETSTVKKNRGHIGIIGCGNFAYSNIAYYLKKNYGHVIRAAMDIDINRAASLFEKYSLAYYTDSVDQLINDQKIKLIYIASNHSSHAEYAISALGKGKNVHIEKPHVVSEDQLQRLCSAMKKSNSKVGIGFNRPTSKIGKAIKYHLDSQSGPSMFNWFIAGHEIDPDHWYFKEEEGGRVLGNLCHWTDFILQMVPKEKRYPITITPTRGKQSDCDISVTYLFGDDSIAAITFSAKGHTFEGVRERFAAHRGNVLISMDDFKNLTVENVEKKYKLSPMFRDHGHELNIKNSYGMVRSSNGKLWDGCSVDYVWETGMLFLKTREALEKNKQIILQAFPKTT